MSTTELPIFEQALLLAKAMKVNPDLVELPLVAEGESLFAIYQDSNFSDRFNGVKELKTATYKMAIEDISMGAPMLAQSVIGLTFKENRIQTYISPHGNSISGNNVFSISLKNLVAFKGYRAGISDPVADQLINSGLYFLTFQLSKYLEL